MNTSSFATAIIRDRGQLTIPDSIREKFPWVNPHAVVLVDGRGNDEIVIRPYTSLHKEVDWDKLWKEIKRVRAFKGKGRGNLSRFIASDRGRH